MIEAGSNISYQIAIAKLLLFTTSKCLPPLLNPPFRATFFKLRLGRSSQFIVGHLLRFWDSQSIKKNGEL